MERKPGILRAERSWLGGGSALPLVELLSAEGWIEEAAAVARLALDKPECEDRSTLEQLLESFSLPPDGWAESLADFAAAASLERWRELMRFVPVGLLYLRQKAAIHSLRERGLSGDLLFLCATEFGMMPEAIQLVEDGIVSVDTILARSSRSGSARTTYLGLAAQAAFLRGDLIGSVRLLRESMEHENAWCSALPHVAFILEKATAEELETLNRLGISSS